MSYFLNLLCPVLEVLLHLLHSFISLTQHALSTPGWYPHPDVPQASNAVKIQREVVYCPENRFITYDVAVMHTDNTQGTDVHTACFVGEILKVYNKRKNYPAVLQNSKLT